MSFWSIAGFVLGAGFGSVIWSESVVWVVYCGFWKALGLGRGKGVVR